MVTQKTKLSKNIVRGGEAQKAWDPILERAREKAKKKIAVISPENIEIFVGLQLAQELVEPYLIGNEEKIRSLLEKVPIPGATVVATGDATSSIEKGIALAREGEVQLLMKGMVRTPDFLRRVIARESGLRTGFLSHIAAHSLREYPKLLFITDAGLNPEPPLEQKALILKNAIGFLKRLGIDVPKVACVASVETVHPDLKDTVDAAALATMAERNQFGEAIVEGPLGLDMAVSKNAAKLKGYMGKVPGEVDLILVPDVVSGNLLSKSLIYFGGAEAGGVVIGGKIPIVLLSRADSPIFKFYSIALGLAAY